MKIVLQLPDSNSEIQLTGDKPEEGISGGVLTHNRLQEQIARVRAESMTHRDRGNKSNTLSFSITREFSTPGLAGLYWLQHADSLPGTATVVFRSEEPGGLLAGETRLPNATILGSRGEWDGCSCTYNYQIQGGAFAINPS